MLRGFDIASRPILVSVACEPGRTEASNLEASGIAVSRIDSIKELLADDPQDPDLHLMLAAELRQAGDYAEAANALRRYLALMPPAADLGSAYRDLGICLERLGQTDAARETWRKALEAAAAHRHAGLQSEIESLLQTLPRQ